MVFDCSSDDGGCFEVQWKGKSDLDEVVREESVFIDQYNALRC